MSIFTEVNGTAIPQAEIKLDRKARPPRIPNESGHNKLLEYLLARISHDKTNAQIRGNRYARIDKMVSTWQTLTKEDAARRAKQENTGESQAISINLPIQFTHIDDLVSFFSGVYAPNSGSFYEEPNDDQNDTKKRLDSIKKMNADARKHKYFKELCRCLRALMKYNIGGLSVEWKPTAMEEPNMGSNRVCGIDMYNFYWDPAIDDPSKIPLEAEWAAIASRTSRMRLIKGEKAGEYHGIHSAINVLEGSNGNIAEFYRYPPNHAGLNSDGQDNVAVKGGRANWESYGVGLAGEGGGAATLDNTHELVEMYCWFNPHQFGIRIDSDDGLVKDDYVLFRATILDGKRIISLDPVGVDDDNPQPNMPPRIPYFVGFLNQDDMGVAQRSIAELLAPFQTYGSFLLNAHIAGSRGSIYGIQVYDPEVIELKDIPPGSTVARIPSKKPGTDLRAALQTINGSADTGKAMDDLGKLMGLVDKFFPGQALPSQIAGIDRAVQSQVAAVMQGVNRRLHMLVRTTDDDILGPSRYEQIGNMMRVGAGDFTGLTESDILAMVGSGLAQLNRETAAQAMQQLLFAIIQNPKSAEQYDVIGLMNFWSRMLNIDADLERFKLQPQQPAATDPNAAPPAVPPGAV